MRDLYVLPAAAEFAGKKYGIHGDFREILEIFSYLQDESLPENLRWRIAVALFYEEEIPGEALPEALTFLADFIAGGETAPSGGGAKLLDWEQDANLIVAEINRVSHQEIRALPFLHWWTFLGWFHGIGQGQLSTLVSVRDKLRRGKKLEDWEREFYRQNKQRVDMKKAFSPEELRQRQELEAMLNKRKEGS